MAKLVCGLFSLTLTLSVLDLVLAYPWGAPDSACDSMRPLHKYKTNNSSQPALYEPQTTKSDVRIQFEKRDQYFPYGSVEVILRSEGGFFKGFLVEAHDVNANFWDTSNPPLRYGEFITDGSYSKSTCWNQALSHSQRKDFMIVRFYWNPPVVMRPRTFVFRATIVKNFSTIYMNVVSDRIQVIPYDMAGTAVKTNTIGMGLLFLVAMATALFHSL